MIDTRTAPYAALLLRVSLALQLHSLFEMGAACFGLVSSSPE